MAAGWTQRRWNSCGASCANIEHNGLQNINRRIWLGYGGDSGLTIDSAEGEGFTVKLKLRRGGR